MAEIVRTERWLDSLSFLAAEDSVLVVVSFLFADSSNANDCDKMMTTAAIRPMNREPYLNAEVLIVRDAKLVKQLRK